MATTPVGSGTTVSNQEVTSGNTLDVQSGGVANTTKVDNGGTLQVDSGGTENNATILAGGTETVAGTINSSNVVTASGTSTGDDIFGTVNVTSGGIVSGAKVENGGSLNLTLKSATANNITVLAGGKLTINGNAPANNVTLQGGLLDLQSPKADTANTSGAPSATGNLTFASGYNSTLQIDVAQTGTNGTTFAQTIAGYAAGDVVDLQFLTRTGATIAQTQNGTSTNVTVSGGSGSGSETFTFANTTAGNFSLASDAGTGSEIVYAATCFTTGTRIATARGQVRAEDLVVGDLAVTASGALRPIRWIGHRLIAGDAMSFDLWPVRIRAGAFGVGLPARELMLSPGHPVLVRADEDGAGGHLVPIMCLVNGTTVRRVAVETVTYWHVELDEHDILLAEGLPAESYLDWGDRAFFGEGAAHALANPDFVVPGLAGRCRPVAVDGPVVEAERRRLDAIFDAALVVACAWPEDSAHTLW